MGFAGDQRIIRGLNHSPLLLPFEILARLQEYWSFLRVTTNTHPWHGSHVCFLYCLSCAWPAILHIMEALGLGYFVERSGCCVLLSCPFLNAASSDAGGRVLRFSK